MRLRVLYIILFATSAVVAVHGAVCMSGAIYSGSEMNISMTDLLLTELSQNTNIVVVERQDIDFLLKEMEMKDLYNNAMKQVSLGNFLGVDSFLWVIIENNLAMVDIVEASTGRGIYSFSIPCNSNSILEVLPDIVERGIKSAEKGLPPVGAASPRLAIIDPEEKNLSEKYFMEMKRVISLIIEDLKGNDIEILSRTAAHDAVKERWRIEKGLVREGLQESALLGADYCMVVKPGESDLAIELQILEVRTGRRMRSIPVAISDAAKPEIRKDIVDQIMAVVKLASKDSKKKKLPKRHQGEFSPEVFSSFFKGITDLKD